ncbi:MAG: ATP-binding protein [Christensenellaceae bacterium]|jgi:predicted AAA+ superfamily ATPase
MERKILKQIKQWKQRPDRMPLILNGARQVGKTYAALMFGKQEYKNTAYFSMEDSQDVTRIFEQDFNIDRIISELAAQSRQTILKEDTLIILDEIQASERALLSLKYFCENAPKYHIIAAGSLLGVALNREKYSFPVGKVDMMTLYPLDFEEFLWATENRELASLIQKAYDAFSEFSLHNTTMDLYRQYLATGGMPRAVSEFIEKQDYNFVASVLQTINDTYIADMAKYATPNETTKIMAVFNSIPSQLAKENRKFQYKVIKSGARASAYEVAIDWLRASGVIIKCTKVKEGIMPIKASEDMDSFKIYLTDTGLLSLKLGIPANAILTNTIPSDATRGALAENYVASALTMAGYKPHYWESDGKAEIDFVVQDKQGDVIPVEVKSADNVKSKSLNVFMNKYDAVYAIRVSQKNFGFENKIISIPLYAVWCLRPD